MENNKMKPSEERIWEKHYSEEAKNFTYPKMNIYDLVYEENRNRKDLPAIEYEGNIIRYGDFFEKVEEKTEFFKSKKLNSNDIVTMSMLMTPEFVYDWYALSRLHVLSNLIDPRTSAAGIREYIKEADSNLILNTDIFNGKIKKAIQSDPIKVVNYSLSDSAKNLSFPLNLVSTFTGLSSKITSQKDYRFENYHGVNNNIDSVEKKNNTDSIEESYRQNTPLTVVHTGGTTGTPKGVVLSHDNYNAMAMEYLKSGIGFTEGDSFLLIMPPWISYGSGMLHLSMVTGMKSIIIPKLDSKKMPVYLVKYKPQWFAGVPVHFYIITNSRLIKTHKVDSVKAGAVGGGAMSEELFESSDKTLLDNGAKKGTFPGYALTESTSAFAVRQTKAFKAQSVGNPLPGCTVGIFKFDENTGKTYDIELDYNKVGEICLRTPNMMLGYFKNDELTNEVLVMHSDGKKWIHTGDLGHIDKDGFLYIDGRIKELITRYDGFKVYPSQIDKIVLSFNEVASAKTVGINDNIHSIGEVPKVFLTLKEEYLDDKNDIIEAIRKKCKYCLSEYYVEGITFDVLEKLPLTPIGKEDYKKLQEMGNAEMSSYSRRLKK